MTEVQALTGCTSVIMTATNARAKTSFFMAD
jgi:hypothetical protein